MNRWITRANIMVLCLFVGGCLSAAAYDWWFVWPVQKCDTAGAWWDARDHQCLTPMPIWRITGRSALPKPPAGSTR